MGKQEDEKEIISIEDMQAELAQANKDKEAAIVQRDTISEDYRSQRSEADKLKDFTAKMKHTLEDKGIAKFDDGFNITLLEKQEVADSEEAKYETQLQEVEVKFEMLTEKFDAGEIEPDKYTKEHNKLIREQNNASRGKDSAILKQTILETQANADRERKELQVADKQQFDKQSEHDYFSSKLTNQFPEHNSLNGLPDVNSDLVKEVNAIIAEDPRAWDTTELNEDMKERYKIFERAKDRLVAKGVMTREEATNRTKTTNARFSTLDSTPYEPTEKKSTFLTETPMGDYVKNKFGKDTLKDLSGRFDEYEKSGTMTIES